MVLVTVEVRVAVVICGSSGGGHGSIVFGGVSLSSLSGLCTWHANNVLINHSLCVCVCWTVLRDKHFMDYIEGN